MGGQKGVEFMVKIHLKNYIQDFLGVTDRIATLNMKIPKYKKRWTIIQAYASTEQANKSEHEFFYSKLSQTIITHSNNTIILIGDFIAQVGAKQNEDEYVLGKFGHGKRSENGQRLVDFLLEHNLTLLNSIFKKNENKWTWMSPDGKSRNRLYNKQPS
ncbi:Craniofacial development protein 2 [Eumeta japonica]|uniref:Craniofacial development protein 2 n=1 Tax=Eumeta variegata TaxID=151549 RepID=A0A4C1W5U3_EUMVA|nr:Craniofacial development protein 2 [Eumeta japonica]